MSTLPAPRPVRNFPFAVREMTADEYRLDLALRSGQRPESLPTWRRP